MSEDDNQLSELFPGKPDKETQEALDQVGLAQEPVMPGDHLLNLILAATEPTTRFEGFVERLSELFDLSDTRIRELLATIDEAGNPSWKASALPGTRLLRFDGGPKLAAATCGLVKVKPGRIFPAHQHQADEWVFVLQGRAQEDSGRVLQAGDLDLGAAGTSHTFRTMGDEPFVFAVVLFKDNKWLLGQTLMDHLQPRKRFGPDETS